jgi:hypothetical protein
MTAAMYFIAVIMRTTLEGLALAAFTFAREVPPTAVASVDPPRSRRMTAR